MVPAFQWLHARTLAALTAVAEYTVEPLSPGDPVLTLRRYLDTGRRNVRESGGDLQCQGEENDECSIYEDEGADVRAEM